MAVNYFKAKMARREEDYKNRLKVLNEKLTEDSVFNLRQADAEMEEKFDFMYNYLDYDSDRSVVRAKFMNEVNKRSTLEDIGETLDRLTIGAKADNYKYYDAAEHLSLIHI